MEGQGDRQGYCKTQGAKTSTDFCFLSILPLVAESLMSFFGFFFRLDKRVLL